METKQVGVSIVIPCLKTPTALVKDIKKQKFKDYEIVLSKGKMPIPRAYNNGIKMAKGRRIVILGSDIRIYSKDWLSQMVKLIDKHKIIRADAAIIQKYGFSSDNVGIMADIAKANLFDESFPIGEDTEWLYRLKSQNYKVVKTREPVVWHYKELDVNKILVWPFHLGASYSRIAMQYKGSDMTAGRIIAGRGAAIVSSISMLLGTIYGFIRYSYVLFKRK